MAKTVAPGRGATAANHRRTRAPNNEMANFWRSIQPRAEKVERKFRNKQTPGKVEMRVRTKDEIPD